MLNLRAADTYRDSRGQPHKTRARIRTSYLPEPIFGGQNAGATETTSQIDKVELVRQIQLL